MEKSIENIWKEGFINKDFIIPKIEKMYNKKSISYAEKMIIGFKYEVFILIPAIALIFLLNIWLDNDNPIFWGFISSVPSIVWFFVGLTQLKSLVKFDYLSSSYDYLVSIRKKMISIRKFNRNLAISSVPILLFPMVLYTYYKQEGKTIGEIFDIEGLNYPTIFLFLMIPIFTVLVAIIAQINFKVVTTKTTLGINSLIGEIEELRK